MQKSINIPTPEREWSVKELDKNKSFPYKQRMIWKFIKSGKLKTKNYSPKKIRITQSEIENFLKRQEKANAKK
ncbi:MAG: hypothetical protein V4549_03595 [Bacteroidota bacterium]